MRWGNTSVDYLWSGFSFHRDDLNVYKHYLCTHIIYTYVDVYFNKHSKTLYYRAISRKHYCKSMQTYMYFCHQPFNYRVRVRLSLSWVSRRCLYVCHVIRMGCWSWSAEWPTLSVMSSTRSLYTARELLMFTSHLNSVCLKQKHLIGKQENDQCYSSTIIRSSRISIIQTVSAGITGFHCICRTYKGTSSEFKKINSTS